jgi:hypothetical protein
MPHRGVARPLGGAKLSSREAKARELLPAPDWGAWAVRGDGS